MMPVSRHEAMPTPQRMKSNSGKQTRWYRDAPGQVGVWGYAATSCELTRYLRQLIEEHKRDVKPSQ